MARDALAADRKYYASVENYEGELAALRAALAAEKKARAQEHQMLTTQAMMMKTLNRNLKAQLKALEAKYRQLDQQYKDDSKELHHQLEDTLTLTLILTAPSKPRKRFILTRSLTGRTGRIGADPAQRRVCGRPSRRGGETPFEREGEREDD